MTYLNIEALEFRVVDVDKSLLDGLFDAWLGFPRIKALDIAFITPIQGVLYY